MSFCHKCCGFYRWLSTEYFIVICSDNNTAIDPALLLRALFHNFFQHLFHFISVCGRKFSDILSHPTGFLFNLLPYFSSVHDIFQYQSEPFYSLSSYRPLSFSFVIPFSDIFVLSILFVWPDHCNIFISNY